MKKGMGYTIIEYMSVLEIRKFRDPVLRKKSEGVDKIDYQFLSDLSETMVKKDGIGLAAPQVGVSKRIIAVMDPEKGKPLVLINPVIVKKSKEKETGEEGCLSFPGIFLKVKRAKEIEAEALNREGEKISFKAEGLAARVIQHEIDHLDGILFFHRLCFLRRILFKIRHPLL